MTSLPLFAVWAIAGHLANGGAFVIDKILLRKSFSRPATYAGIVGLLGVIGFLLLPWTHAVPDVLTGIWIAVSGATFVLALLCFFAALASGEASRIVPVVGSLIPMLTLVGTWSLLGERLSPSQGVGFALLIVATVILSGGSVKSKLTGRAMGLAALAAVVFAISSITGKASYDAAGFITSFAYARIFGAVTAVFILASDPAALREVRNAFFPKPARRKTKSDHAVALVLFGQALGSSGFLLVQYAMSLGSAAIVNALQAVQYAFLVLAAFIFAKRAPGLLGEDLTPKTVLRKSIAILFVAIGLWYVV